MISVYSRSGSSLDAFPFTATFFPGGEPNVVLSDPHPDAKRLVIDARLVQAWELATLLCLTDALRRCGVQEIELFCPYFPGARQDRVEPGSGCALTARVYADVINAQRYSRVFVVDPHSDVVPALLDRCTVLQPNWMIAECVRRTSANALLCPDAGAQKRTYRIAEGCGIKTVHHARKHRDCASGKLSGFEVEAPSAGSLCLIVDDICDGGGTFLGIAEKAGPPRGERAFELHLWVTHGIFSKGIAPLMRVFDSVWTTDSIPPRESHARLQTLSLLEHFGHLLLRD